MRPPTPRGNPAEAGAGSARARPARASRPSCGPRRRHELCRSATPRRSASEAMSDLEGRVKSRSKLNRPAGSPRSPSRPVCSRRTRPSRPARAGENRQVVSRSWPRVASAAWPRSRWRRGARVLMSAISEIQAETMRGRPDRLRRRRAHGGEESGTVELTRDAFERIDAAIEKMHVRIGDVADTARDVAAGSVTLQSDRGSTRSPVSPSAPPRPASRFRPRRSRRRRPAARSP